MPAPVIAGSDIVSKDALNTNYAQIYTDLEVGPGDVTDSLIGDRTPVESGLTISDLLGHVFLDWLTSIISQIKVITGATHWYSAPAASIATLWGKFNASTGHTHSGSANDGPPVVGAMRFRQNSIASVVVSNSASQTDLLTTTIPSGTVNSASRLKITLRGRIQNTTGTTYTVSFHYDLDGVTSTGGEALTLLNDADVYCFEVTFEVMQVGGGNSAVDYRVTITDDDGVVQEFIVNGLLTPFDCESVGRTYKVQSQFSHADSNLVLTTINGIIEVD